MKLPRLPLTVIAGYLGAGKTTMINRLLAEDHGLRLLVMVNDFGSINIDAELLTSADEDTMTLTNGCVCCTMGADLFMALGDALDRRPRPDHVIIEASGVADPARIANAAIAEPEMSYGGIVTVVDGQTFMTLSEDELIGPQICGQVSQSDLILVSSTRSLDSELVNRLSELSNALVLSTEVVADLGALILDTSEQSVRNLSVAAHPPYVSWSYTGEMKLNREEIDDCLRSRPAGLFRMKGVITDYLGSFWEVQVVGERRMISKATSGTRTKLVGIGLKAQTNRAEIEGWWSRVTQKSYIKHSRALRK